MSDHLKVFLAGKFRAKWYPGSMVTLEVPNYALSITEPVETRFDTDDLPDLIYVLTRMLKEVERDD